MLLAEARDEIDRLRLTDEERQAIDRQADWLAMEGPGGWRHPLR
jgi:dethiobiotin synthetase